MRDADPFLRSLLFAAALAFFAGRASAQVVDVIEYYNASQDHYFISSLQPDITALDTGQLKGWVRTGRVFSAYAQMTGVASPVCRFYIPPAQGDSHFYSASPTECAQTQAKFPTFVEESPDVMYIDLPDATTGACPAADIPVYRVWDNRVDSNHRYTTDPTVRAAMVAQGWIAEGYGPDQVIMCAPKPLVPVPSGLFVLNEAANLASTAAAYATGMVAAPAYAGDVTGHAIFVPIAKILPAISVWGQFNWDWTYVDTLVQLALANGKKFSIELETGFQSGATYTQSLPAGFAALCGVNCAPLFDVWTTGGGSDRCISAYVLLPWVPNVQQFWSSAAFALSAHLRQTGAYPALTLVHVPGLSVYDEEIRLPTGMPSPTTTDTGACPDGRPAYPTVQNDAASSRWQSLGYSDAAVTTGFQTIATAFSQAFPDRTLGLSLFNPGANGADFPNLNGDPVGTVAGEIVQAVNAIAPGRVQLQSDNLDSNFVQAQVTNLATQYSDRVAWQSNKHGNTGAGCAGGGVGSCDPDGTVGPYFQLLKAGAVNRAAYLEIWSADVVSYPQALDAARAAGYYPGFTPNFSLTVGAPIMFATHAQLASYGFLWGPSDGAFGAIPASGNRYTFYGTASGSASCAGTPSLAGAYTFAGTLDLVTGSHGCRRLFGPGDAPAGYVFDRDYAGGGQVVPFASGGNSGWLMPFHGEFHWQNAANPPTFKCNVGTTASLVPCFYSSLGLAVSTDNGKTFRVAGEIVQPSEPLSVYQAGGKNDDVGYGSLLVADANGRHLDNPPVDPSNAYFYVLYSDSLAGLPGTCATNHCMAVARAPYASVVAAALSGNAAQVAQTFHKYDATLPNPWTQPATAYVPGDPAPDLAGTAGKFAPLWTDETTAEPVVLYDRAFDVYLAAYPFGTGPKVRASDDLIHWSGPVGTSYVEAGRTLFYATLIGETGDPTIGGLTPRMYFSSFPTGSFPDYTTAIFESVPLTLAPLN